MRREDLELLTLDQLISLIDEHEYVVFHAVTGSPTSWRVHFQEPDYGGKTPTLYVDVNLGTFELYAEKNARLDDYKLRLADEMTGVLGAEVRISDTEFLVSTVVYYPKYLVEPHLAGDSSPLLQRGYIDTYFLIQAWCRVFDLKHE